MDKAINLPQSTPDIDFWKGFLFGTMAGMVIAAYTYALTDFKLLNPEKILTPLNEMAEKAAAA